MINIIGTKVGFLFFLGLLLSCSRNVCKTETFYSIYQARFHDKELSNNFVKGDLDSKKKVFSTLCISKKINKMLIVEDRNATQLFFSRGLLFTYDDSTIYYYQMKEGKIKGGIGNNGYSDLNKILVNVKKDFSAAKAKIGKKYEDIFDAPIVNVLLYDVLNPSKFDSFSFPIVVGDSLYMNR
jgi:hypothetical protein